MIRYCPSFPASSKNNEPSEPYYSSATEDRLHVENGGISYPAFCYFVPALPVLPGSRPFHYRPLFQGMPNLH